MTRSPIAVVITSVLAFSATALAGDESVALDNNWNGILHAGESGAPDNATGYRAIADRGLTQGTADALGGTTGSVDGFLSYTIVAEASTLDTVYIGGPRDAGQGITGFDVEFDFDNVGVPPSWDPSGATAIVDSATMAIPSVTMAPGFALGVLYNSSVGGGDFDVTLGFASGESVTVTLNAPDWFANFDGNPSAPGSGVASQALLIGPLSGGDGFEGSGSTDFGNPDAPLNVVEGVITFESLAALGTPILDEELTSITFDNANGGNPFMTVGIYAATIRLTPITCDGDIDGDSVVGFSDLLLVLGAWGPCGGGACPEDIDENGSVDFGDLLAVLGDWGDCPVFTGACCLPGECQVLTLIDCIAAGGSYAGNDSDCETACAGETVTAPFTDPGDLCTESNDCGLNGGNDKQWVVTIPFTANWTFSVCGAEFDTVIHLGSTPCSNDLGTDDDAFGCGLASELTVQLTPGTYFLTLEGFNSAQCGPYTMTASN